MNGFFDRPAIVWLVILLLVKSTFVLLAAAIAARVIRRASAAAHHVIWASAIAGVLLLPLFAVSLPTWKVFYAARPAAGTKTEAASTAFPEPSNAAPMTSGAAHETPGLSPQPSEAPTAPAVESASETPKLMEPSHGAASSGTAHIPWAAAVAALWIFGVFLTLARFFLGLRLVSRVRLGGAALDARAMRVAAETQAQMGVRRRVDFRRAVEGGVTVPITWGVVRPVVLLPAQSVDWSDECLRSVLLHELAHIGRGDWLTQCAAHLACALYWFHPLVWFAARQSREAGERACDDCVLRAGVAPTEYARRLVDVLKSLPEGAKPRTVAIAMALPRETEGRIRAVLAAGLNRSAVNRLRILIAFALTLTVLIPISALRPFALVHADTPSPMASEEPPAHRLSRGVLQFVYLKDVACRRDPNRPITMSILRNAAGGELYRFTDQRTGQEFGDAGHPPPVPAGGFSGQGGSARKLAFRKQVQEYNRWWGLMYDSPVIVTDADIVKAEAHLGGATGRDPAVKITFSPEGAKKLAAYTAAHVGETMGVISDGSVLMAPNINTPITDGTCDMAASFRTLQDAQTLADRLNGPAETEITSPTLYRHTLADGTTVQEIHSGWSDPAVVAPDYEATLGNGAHIKIDSLAEATDYIKKQNVTLNMRWSPDGDYLDRTWTPGKYGGAGDSDRENPSRIIKYTIGPSVGDASLYTEVVSGVQTDSPTIVRKDVSSRSVVTVSQTLRFPKTAKMFSMRIGVARQAWTTIASLPARVNTTTSISDKGFILEGADIELKADDRPALISSSHNGALHLEPFLTGARALPNVARRFVAVDASGAVLPLKPAFRDRKGVDSYGFSYNRSSPLAKFNPRLNLANTARFELQTRPYEVVEFRNIPLHRSTPDLPMTPEERARRVEWLYAQSATMHNMRLISLAILEYMQDNDEKMPMLTSLGQIRKTLAPYLAFQEKQIDSQTGLPNRAIGNDVFISRVTGKPYRFNAALSGWSISRFDSPATAVLFRDAPAVPPYNNVPWENVAFVDGHVKGRNAVTRP